MSKQTIAIIGGGSAALMLACEIDTSKYKVTIYEKNAGLGRKFLVAGKGGFNLTHSTPIDLMKENYVASTPILSSLDAFTNEDFIFWLKKEGIETFVGSSKRIFPVKPTKPIQVLQAFEKKIKANGVNIQYNSSWLGFEGEQLIIENEGKTNLVSVNKVVFALGGASWQVTGSQGDWLAHFETKGIKMIPFQASNCGLAITWKEKFAKINEGQPLKSISVSCGNIKKKGDVIITRLGLEGSAVYALSPAIRNQIEKNGEATIYIDLKPTTSEESILRKMHSSKKKNSWSEHIIWQLKLSKQMFDLVKRTCSKEEFTNPEFLAKHLKNIPLQVTGFDSIDKAISTVGGIDLEEITNEFELKKLPNHYIIGEMLDWDAPTGGYLLQCCMSMGFKLGKIL
jgi:uncharacterized flavoprotein (TIGR03862 family)